MQDFYVFKTKRRRSNYVRQIDVLHKSKKKTFWVEGENSFGIENLAKELGQSEAKVANDIFSDFFLDRKLEQQKFELEGIEWLKTILI